MSGTQPPPAGDRLPQVCKLIALSLFLSFPLSRVVEALGRLVFQPSFYDSLAEALTEEMWFSETWWLYICSPFGRWMLYLIVAWAAAIPVVLLLPMVQWRKSMCLVTAILLLAAIEVATFRLELYWDGRSQSEWVWCLRSHDPELRRQAAAGLTFHTFKFGVPMGVEAMMSRALGDDLPEVRGCAASFFVRHPTARVVPELLQALDDPDEQVCQLAAEAIAEIGKPDKLTAPLLEKRLDHENPAVRVSMARAYLRSGGALRTGLDVLMAAAGNENVQVRIQAAHALAQIGKDYPDDVTPALQALLGDKDHSVRFYATLAIYDLGPLAKPLIPALLVNLKDEDRFVRGSAASAFGKIRSDEDRVLLALQEGLHKDADPSVRSDCAYSLGYIENRTAVPALELALKDPVEHVRKGAQEALDRLGWSSPAR